MSNVVAQSRYASDDQPGVLRRILDPGVQLGLWQRPAQAVITQELSSLKASALPDVRCTTSRGTFDNDVDSLLQKQGFDPTAFTNWRSDLRQLANIYFHLSKNRDVEMRLETTDEDGCTRFHVDSTQPRLLCTYQGPGTQWLTDEQVDRKAQSSGASNEDIVRFGEPSSFAPFWVGIFKGKTYPGNSGQGLVHRSPPIEGSGQIRVLFCLDS